jgi:hypothetical protein
MNKMPNLVVSKLEAARRQLETAIVLYFNEGDPVSIHTLTAAAYNVIRDINEKRSGLPMVIKGYFLDYIKPEFVPMMKKKINEAETFFKHAQKDPDETLTFNPDTTQLLILDACNTYRSLADERVPTFLVFGFWIMLKYPKVYTMPPEFKAAYDKLPFDQLLRSPQEFYKAILPITGQLPF